MKMEGAWARDIGVCGLEWRYSGGCGLEDAGHGSEGGDAQEEV